MQIPRDRVNWGTPREVGSLPSIPSDTLPSTGRHREDWPGIPRETHPDSWVPILPFMVQISIEAALEPTEIGVGLGAVDVAAAGGVAAAEMTVDLGVITMGATAEQFAAAVETEDDRQLGEQDLAAAAKIEPLTLIIDIGQFTVPAAAKLEPLALTVGFGNQTLGAAGKLEPVGAPGLDLGQRSLSLAAKVEGIAFIADLGQRNLSAGAKIEPLSTPKAGRSYIDTLNRSNGSTLGSNWAVSHNSGCQIISNAAHARTASSNTGRQGGWNAYQGAEFSDSGRLYSDNWRIKAQLKAPATAAANNNYTVIGVTHDTWNQAGINKIYLIVSTGNGSAIVTQSGSMNAAGISSGRSGQTNVVTVATNVANTDLIEFERVGNVFTAYKNGATWGLSWTDASNTVPTGSSFRKPCLAIECNFPIFQQQFSAPGIDQIEFWDL